MWKEDSASRGLASCADPEMAPRTLDIQDFPLQPDLFAQITSTNLANSAQNFYNFLTQIENATLIHREQFRLAYGLQSPAFSAMQMPTLTNDGNLLLQPGLASANPFVASSNIWGGFLSDPVLQARFPAPVVSGTLQNNFTAGITPVAKGAIPFASNGEDPALAAEMRKRWVDSQNIDAKNAANAAAIKAVNQVNPVKQVTPAAAAQTGAIQSNPLRSGGQIPSILNPQIVNIKIPSGS